jgi:hypothetical protein
MAYPPRRKLHGHRPCASQFAAGGGFSREQDRKVGSDWGWQTLGREELRRALDFFVGEAADGAFGLLPGLSTAGAAPATGPP